MTLDEAIDLTWAAWERGDTAPEALRGAITMEQAYQVQDEMLRRLLKGGRAHSGWKIGGNTDAARKLFGPSAPFRGFLLAEGAAKSGREFTFESIPGQPVIEAEICVTLGRSLPGPQVTRSDVVAAISEIAPAFEVARLGHVPGIDLPHMVADNVAQFAYVTGEPKVPQPGDLDFTDITLELRKNGEVAHTCRLGDLIDDQIESLVWLANDLIAGGMKLEAGQRIMTGSCLRPQPSAKGDRWDASFSGLGNVAVSIT
jgi:2-keto-4-pentenoate hydratase